MSEPKHVYPPADSDSYKIPFDDSFSRKPLEEQRKELREKLAALPNIEVTFRTPETPATR